MTSAGWTWWDLPSLLHRDHVGSDVGDPPVSKRVEHAEPDLPTIPLVFALGDPVLVGDLATAAGFSDVTIEPIDFAFRYEDEDDAWQAVVDLNGPLAVIIDRLSLDERDSTRREVLDGLERFRETDGSYPVPAQALAVHAR